MNTVIIILVTLMIISSISATSAQTTIRVTPTTLNKSGDKVHVTWAHIPNPTTQDWLGIYSPATSPDTNFIGYFFLNSSSTWHTGGGSLTFPLINLRGHYHFRIFRQPDSSAGNRLPVAGTILVESGEVGFARPNGPEQVHLGFTEREDEMRVVFVAGDGGERVVKYGEVEEEEEEGGGLTFESQTRVERYEVDDMCDSPANTSVGWRDPGFIFDGVMTHLKKGTRYYYKVGSDSGGWSPTYNFVSRNEDSDETIAFLFGDIGTATPYETFTRTQAESTSTVKWILRDIEALGEKPAFISHIGDISYAKGYAWLWDNFFNQIEPLASRVAYHVCMGNHEYDWPQQPWKPDWASYNKDGGGECGVPYSLRFKMPGNSSLPTGTRAPATRNLYYSFNMGSVHFVYFSTEINFLRGSDQYDFLKRDLENVNRTKTPFVVVQGHRPMYTTSNNVWDAPIRERMMSHLEPLFVENKVTLALWGHVHRYERFCPLNNFTCGETQDGFPVHAVIGMAGRDWQSIWEPRPEHPDMPVFIQPKRSLYRGGEFGYTRLVATKQKLTLSYVGNHDGQVHDRVEILATGEALSGGDDMFATIFNAKNTDKMKIKGSRSLYISQFMKGAILLVFGAIVGYLIGFFISRPKNETGVSGNSWIPMKTEDAEIELQNDDKTSLCVENAFAPDSGSIASSIKYHAEFSPSFSPEHFELPKAYFATAESVRDMLIINWNATYDYYEKTNVKQAYYLSMEFLQGRALLNAIGNLELSGPYAEALRELGYNLEDVAEQEPDPALGNGGLGRLASCFLDSLATLNYPAWGYGLRYKYGLFKQLITKDGQEEVAENWLEMGNPWEMVRNDVSYPVKFYGKVITRPDGRNDWVGGEDIKAVAYDVPIPGYKTKNTINLRLWSTKVPSQDFDLHAFNAGDHAKAYEALTNAEKICYVLYPGDESLEGKTLRLKQQYTLCSASLQDIVARFEKRSGHPVNWGDFPNKIAVQMNDTHPTLCIPELIRILVDVKGLTWDEAWNVTKKTVAYTNHTVLPEALEKWSLDLLEQLLPRHVEIIKLIDEELLNTIIAEYGTEDLDLLQEKIQSMRIMDNVELPGSVLDILVKPENGSIVSPTEGSEISDEDDLLEEESSTKEEKEGEETSDQTELSEASVAEEKQEPSFEPDTKLPKVVRMANLCVVGGHAVNGVAEIHSEIVKNDVFNDFYKLWPEKFQNKTNGVTPRRWIRFCNAALSQIITKWIGSEDWILQTEKLAELKKFVNNMELQSEWREAKRINKMKVAAYLKEKTGYIVSPDAMFDVQIKRIHEYKRQLLNILGIVYRYKKMKEMTLEERLVNYVPRVCIFGGKAFATYVQAKRIVKFITDVGATVNNDPEIGDLLKVVFVPDYNVSVAEVLIPGSELSQHISTAGMEASGTSNMKFAMNGCLLIGTLDGANVEIREEVGEDNFFLFGAQAHEIADLRKERAEGNFVPDPRFEEVKEYIRSGVFGSYSYDDLMGSLEGNEGYGRADYFLVGKDFPSYIECQEKVDEAYRDQKKWTTMSILNTAGSAKFSSDRTIHQYARDIWGIEPAVLS